MAMKKTHLPLNGMKYIWPFLLHAISSLYHMKKNRDGDITNPSKLMSYTGKKSISDII
jgi:hypothetical protein